MNWTETAGLYIARNTTVRKLQADKGMEHLPLSNQMILPVARQCRWKWIIFKITIVYDILIALTFLASTRLAVASSFSAVTTVFKSTSNVYLPITKNMRRNHVQKKQIAKMASFHIPQIWMTTPAQKLTIKATWTSKSNELQSELQQCCQMWKVPEKDARRQ